MLTVLLGHSPIHITEVLSATLLCYNTEVKVKVSQSCPTLWDPMDYTEHGILQATKQKWVAIPSSRGSSQPRRVAIKYGAHSQKYLLAFFSKSVLTSILI